MSVDRKNLCPNCGAQLTGLELKCPECGYVLAAETAVGQKTTESLLSLQEKLLAVDKVFTPGASSSKKKATIINAFPIPNTTESLIRLLHLSYSNFEASKEAGDKKLSLAWLGKAVESYRRLGKADKDDAVTSALEEYKVLGDKKVFSKLSGSYSKKRNWIISGVAIIAILAAFVLWYDWAGLLVKNGKEETAVRLLNFMGQREKAITVLEDEGRYERAAEILSSRGRMFDAVSLLARNGLIKEALILTGKTNSADSIHLFVDEISKHYRLGERLIINLEDNWIQDKDIKILLFDHNRLKHRVEFSIKDSSIIWWDFLQVNEGRIIPERVLKYAPFDNWYGGGCYLPELPGGVKWSQKVTRKGGVVSKIIIANPRNEKEYIAFDFVYELPLTLLKETMTCDGRTVAEVKYDYSINNKDQLKSAHVVYYLDEGDSLLEKYHLQSMNNNRSSTVLYDYDDGQMVKCSRVLDGHGRLLLYEEEFEYYQNIKVWKPFHLDPETKEMIPEKEKTVEIFLDGNVIETFVINSSNL